MLLIEGMTERDRNQGEGDDDAARKYDADVRPDDAARSEQASKMPPHHATVDDLVAKGRTFLERVGRAIDQMKAAWRQR